MEIVKLIERAGRVCYKSEDKITDDSAKVFVSKIKNMKHESVLEHYNITVHFVCNRGFTHELVRHRLASYSQESTRYCNYSPDKKFQGLTVVEPVWFKDKKREHTIWMDSMMYAEAHYNNLIQEGCKPQEARGSLPIDVKTEIIITTNLREWRHIFKLRCNKAAHPSMRQLMIPLLADFKDQIPVVFDDLEF